VRASADYSVIPIAVKPLGVPRRIAIAYVREAARTVIAHRRTMRDGKMDAGGAGQVGSRRSRVQKKTRKSGRDWQTSCKNKYEPYCALVAL